MRRRCVSFAILGLVAATPILGADVAEAPAATVSASAPVAVQQASAPAWLRDEAAMVLVGTALIGLAAAVRRAA